MFERVSHTTWKLRLERYGMKTSTVQLLELLKLVTNVTCCLASVIIIIVCKTKQKMTPCFYDPTYSIRKDTRLISDNHILSEMTVGYWSGLSHEWIIHRNRHESRPTNIQIHLLHSILVGQDHTQRRREVWVAALQKICSNALSMKDSISRGKYLNL